jgi:hypothetical protein
LPQSSERLNEEAFMKRLFIVALVCFLSMVALHPRPQAAGLEFDLEHHYPISQNIGGIALSPDDSTLYVAYWTDTSSDEVEWYSAQDPYNFIKVGPGFGRIIGYTLEFASGPGIRLAADPEICGLTETSPVVDLFTDVWYFVAGVYDASSGFSLYVNDNAYGPISPVGNLFQSTGNLRIGFSSSTIPSQRHFNGVIDEVRVYTRALSDDEILCLYDSP